MVEKRRDHVAHAHDRAGHELIELLTDVARSLGVELVGGEHDAAMERREEHPAGDEPHGQERQGIPRERHCVAPSRASPAARHSGTPNRRRSARSPCSRSTATPRRALGQYLPRQ